MAYDLTTLDYQIGGIPFFELEYPGLQTSGLDVSDCGFPRLYGTSVSESAPPIYATAVEVTQTFDYPVSNYYSDGYGLYVLNEQGHCVVDQDFSCYEFLGGYAGSYNAIVPDNGGRYDTFFPGTGYNVTWSIPSSVMPVIFVEVPNTTLSEFNNGLQSAARTAAGVSIIGMNHNPSTGIWTVYGLISRATAAISVPKIYAFVPQSSRTKRTSGFGLEVYDANGNLTFSDAKKPLVISGFSGNLSIPMSAEYSTGYVSTYQSSGMIQSSGGIPSKIAISPTYFPTRTGYGIVAGVWFFGSLWSKCVTYLSDVGRFAFYDALIFNGLTSTLPPTAALDFRYDVVGCRLITAPDQSINQQFSVINGAQYD